MTTTLFDIRIDNSACTNPCPVIAQELAVSLAVTPQDVRDSQRLRYHVFADEMGAKLDCPLPGIDSDTFDPWCRHVIVRDRRTREVVASTRVLLDAEARLKGGFYSASEFDLGNLRRAAGPMMEVGRTCVHPDYRSGSAISLLWSGLARFIEMHQYQYVIGCASVPMTETDSTASDIYEMLKHKYLATEAERVTPLRPLPASCRQDVETRLPPALPPLLKAYIRLGARIGGEPSWDPDFGCADFFILLSPAAIERRYAKRFMAA